MRKRPPGSPLRRPLRLKRGFLGSTPPGHRATGWTLFQLQLLPRWLTSPDFRLAFISGVSANSVCFERELLDHYRLVFEKKPSPSG